MWNMAHHVMFYPSIFDPRAMTQTPCGNCSMSLQHFIAYVRGANNVTALIGPDAKSPPKTRQKRAKDARVRVSFEGVWAAESGLW